MSISTNARSYAVNSEEARSRPHLILKCREGDRLEQKAVPAVSCPECRLSSRKGCGRTEGRAMTSERPCCFTRPQVHSDRVGRGHRAIASPRGLHPAPRVSVSILCYSTIPTHYQPHASHREKEPVQRREYENVKITGTRPNEKSVLGEGRKPTFIEWLLWAVHTIAL